MKQGTKFLRQVYNNGDLRKTDVLIFDKINDTGDAYIFHELSTPNVAIQMSKTVFLKQLSAHGWQYKKDENVMMTYRLNLDVKLVPNKLRVVHYPQIPTSNPFIVDVKDEFEAKKIYDVIADQHLHLYKHNFIPDYSNMICVQMWDNDLEPDENGEQWCDYWNDEECMEWEEFAEECLF